MGTHIPVMDGTEYSMRASEDTEVMGFRKGLVEALVAAFPTTKEGRRGFLNALATIRMLELPPAYLRSSDVWNLQRQVAVAFDRLATKWDEAYRVR